MAGEVMDRIEPVAKLGGLAVDEARPGTLEIDILQAAMDLDGLVLFAHGVWRFLPRGLRGILARSGRELIGFDGTFRPVNLCARDFDEGWLVRAWISSRASR